MLQPSHPPMTATCCITYSQYRQQYQSQLH